MNHSVLDPPEAEAPPRSIGAMWLTTKFVNGRTHIDRFRTSGSTKVAFPRALDAVEAIMLNTSGGLTGGDRFEASASVGPGSHLILTSQAAERAYRSLSGSARVSTQLTAASRSVLHWLPQELILFDGASLDRRLEVDLDEQSEAIIVEPVVVGRRAMGENKVSGTFRDRITVMLNGATIYCDQFALSGDISGRLNRPAIAAGATAFATVLFYGPRAEAILPRLRRHLPSTGGASLVAPKLLVVRLLATDSFLMRRSLVPILEHLTNTSLPKSWSL